MPKHNWPELFEAQALRGLSIFEFCTLRGLTRSQCYAQRAKQAGKSVPTHRGLLPIRLQSGELRITLQLRMPVSIRGSAVDLAELPRCPRNFACQ